MAAGAGASSSAGIPQLNTSGLMGDEGLRDVISRKSWQRAKHATQGMVPVKQSAWPCSARKVGWTGRPYVLRMALRVGPLTRPHPQKQE